MRVTRSNRQKVDAFKKDHIANRRVRNAKIWIAFLCGIKCKFSGLSYDGHKKEITLKRFIMPRIITKAFFKIIDYNERTHFDNYISILIIERFEFNNNSSSVIIFCFASIHYA